jgi:sugar phosphate isomerase/epimerase
MKSMFPFRLGTTSYILPDDLLPNVEFLGPLVDDVELVLFESDDVSNLPDVGVIEKLAELKRTSQVSYTVHLPIDIQLGSQDETARKQSVRKCLKVIELTGSLAPLAYIIHFDGEMRGRKPAQDVGRWTDRLGQSVSELLSTGFEPESLCVETLDYPFEYVADIVSHYDLSICIDIGHLAFYGYPIWENLDKYLNRCRVIHLHGSVDGVDHKDIGMLDPRIPAMLIRRLGLENDKERVLTLEIFGLEDFERSMAVMRRMAG